MDKIGPIARTAEDCALVFDAIRKSRRSSTACRRPVPASLTAGCSPSCVGLSPEAVRGRLPGPRQRRFAGNPVATRRTSNRWSCRRPVDSLAFILSAEAAAAFDELTCSGLDRMARQTRDAWPNVFRSARFIPAVEYILYNRLRTRLIADTNALFERVLDVLVAPAFEGDTLLLTSPHRPPLRGGARWGWTRRARPPASSSSAGSLTSTSRPPPRRSRTAGRLRAGVRPASTGHPSRRS